MSTRVTALPADAQAAFTKKLAALLEKEGAAYDIAGYRDAPPGLRIWCGATVDTADIEALGAMARLGLRDRQSRTGLTIPLRKQGRTATALDFAREPGFLLTPSRRTCSMTPRVLISDKMAPTAARIFRERGVEVDVSITGKTQEELIAIIGEYDGLAIRSATKVTKEFSNAATNLKVDRPRRHRRRQCRHPRRLGEGHRRDEHAVRQFDHHRRTRHRADVRARPPAPRADASTQAGKWEKNRFMGVEVTGKTLGLIGCGNIGCIVADRALGLKMKVVAFDPFLTPERAVEMGVEKVELDELLARADFITLHTPLTDQTRNILSAENLAKTKKGVRIINCARGGLIDEAALKAALDSGHVAGAALDVFVDEPAKSNRRCSARRTSSPRRIWAHRPTRRRSTSRCRWPSRWPIT